MTRNILHALHVVLVFELRSHAFWLWFVAFSLPGAVYVISLLTYAQHYAPLPLNMPALVPHGCVDFCSTSARGCRSFVFIALSPFCCWCLLITALYACTRLSACDNSLPRSAAFLPFFLLPCSSRYDTLRFFWFVSVPLPCDGVLFTCGAAVLNRCYHFRFTVYRSALPVRAMGVATRTAYCTNARHRWDRCCRYAHTASVYVPAFYIAPFLQNMLRTFAIYLRHTPPPAL